MSLSDPIKHYTQQLKRQGLLRVRQVSQPDRTHTLHFDSNDYLSLTQDPRLAQAYQEGCTQYPVGSGASMLLSGYHPSHQAVEHAFAQFLAVDACVLFASGYAANLAVTALLGAINAHCIIDKAVHASIYDGLALSGVKFTRFKHNDMTHAGLQLKQAPAKTALITEGIFSMSGQIAALAPLSSLCRAHQVELLVDEAHSFGVLGNSGRGAISYHKLTQTEVPLRIIPLGKAFAAQGAIVAGRQDWIEALLQAGRSIIYSTALSPAFSHGLLHTLDVLAAAEDRRQHLNELIAVFKEEIAQSPLIWGDSPTAIQQLQLGCPHLALHYSQELKKMGLNCLAIRSPTVSKKNTGLRIVLNYQHRVHHIKQLFQCLHKIYDYSQ